MNNLAVFASGRGSNFIKIHENIQKGRIPASIPCLISDRSSAAALDYAKEYKIETYILSPKKFVNEEDFGLELLKILQKYSIGWIVLAGYLKKIPGNLVNHFSNKIVNIHPALLPAFGGKGMYGMNVHQAVFQSGAKISGVTVHLVNEIYDSGPIVLQEAVDISDCMTAEEIAKKVLKVEHRVYSEAILQLLTKPFKIMANRVIFEPDNLQE